MKIKYIQDLLVLSILICSFSNGLAKQINTGAEKHYTIDNKGQIIDPAGKVFLPHGANAAIAFTIYPFVFEGNSSDGEPATSAGGVNSYKRWSEKAHANITVSNKVAQLKAWKFNTLRVNAVPYGENNTPTSKETIAGLKKGIDEMTKAGFIVMLEMHSATGKDPVIGQKIEKDIREFWDAIVPYFKNNNKVWFNFFNEPFKDSTKIDHWLKQHSFYVKRYRNAPFNAQNLIICDLPDYAQAIDVLAEGALDGLLKNSSNIVFGWHAYGSVGKSLSFKDTFDPKKSYETFDKLLEKVRTRGYAIIVGELGMATPKNHGNAGPWQWNVNGFNNLVTGRGTDGNIFGKPLARKYKIGLLLWHLTGDTSYYHLYAIRKDRGPWWQTVDNNGKLIKKGGLADQGRLFWDYAHE